MDTGENPSGTWLFSAASHRAVCGNLSLAPYVHCSLGAGCLPLPLKSGTICCALSMFFSHVLLVAMLLKNCVNSFRKLFDLSLLLY